MDKAVNFILRTERFDGQFFSTRDWRLLIHVAETSDGKHLVKRNSSQEEGMSISALEEELIEEEGIGVRSPSHAILEYRFKFDGTNKFQESIRTIKYIYRSGASEEDVSLLYLNGQDDWVQNVLYEMGTPTSENLDAEILFRRQLLFTKVSEESGAQLIEIGNRTVREGFEQKKKEFVERVYELTYDFLVE